MRRADKRRIAHAIERDIEEITGHLGTAFPKSLNSVEQGEFALGYYQQRGYRKPRTAEINTDTKRKRLWHENDQQLHRICLLV